MIEKIVKRENKTQSSCFQELNMYNINMKIDTFEINHRYLVKIWPSYRDIDEVEVLEITKKHIKLKIYCGDGSNYIKWKELRDIEIVEDLGIVTSMIENNLSKTY